MLVKAARRAGVKNLVVAAFVGETDPNLADLVDKIEWMRVGQLGRLLRFFKTEGLRHAMMVGQIAPKNLFDLRPDFKALLVLAKIRERNAESLFSAIANELAAKANTELLPATTFLEDALAKSGHFAGPAPSKRLWNDVTYGLPIVKEVSRLNIGQSIVVKNGTVLAVEGFEGTDNMIRRAGDLSGPKGGGILIKVSKPNQDMRFDVPVIGPNTIETAIKARLTAIAIESENTLLLDKEEILATANARRLTLIGV